LQSIPGSALPLSVFRASSIALTFSISFQAFLALV
jgi:hypothetical protein